ncbi:hypothetical protein M3152_13480 [Sporosarcina luteola]|uniref:hypothetical protein n=1 Tax=Bacillales TaxID=1385 RepID=UPI002042663D|nr:MULTISPECIES: hypothetical protein [Bacillales]MCM3638712.1 hypothetical protein [Sporosarcina luteola]
MKFKLPLLCFFLIFSFSAVVIINSKSAKEVDTTSEISTDLTVYIQQYEELIYEIKQELRKADIGFVLDYAILPGENIKILIKLPYEKIKRSTKKELTKIVNGVLEENNYEPERFHLQISSYHKEPKENTRFSVRLSYNDLMGYIMQELEVKNYTTFSLEYKMASEKVELIINLPVDYDPSINSKVEKIVTDIIEKNHHAKDDFQINVVNTIHTASSARNAEAQEIIKRIQETNFTIKLEEELKRNGYSPNGLMSFQIYSKDKQYIMLYFGNIDLEDETIKRDIQKIVDTVSQANGLGLFIIELQVI